MSDRRLLIPIALFLLLPLCTSPAPAGGQGLDNKGTEFIVGFLPQLSVSSTSIQVHLTADSSTSVTVQYPVNSPTFTQTVAVNPGAITIVTLPVSAAQSWTNNSIQNNAVRLSAAQEFVCYMANIFPFTSDAGLALPIDTMNTEYIILSYTGAFHGSDQSEFLVVAGFDNTTVTITPKQAMVGHAAGVPFNVILNRGQGYLAGAASVVNGDLTGTIVTSDRPVGVTNGNRCTNVPAGNTACDHIFEVAQPTQTWGSEVLVANLPNRPLGSTYRVLASQDSTTVTRDGVSIGTINRGGFIEGPPIAGNHVFAANHPIFVGQYMTGQTQSGTSTGDPALGNMIPAAQYQPGYTFSTIGGSQFAQNFVSIIARNADIGSVLLDGAAVPAGSFAAIGASGFSAAAVSLAQGTHSTSAPSAHGITVEGFNNFDSYIYPGGAQFEFINPVGDANPPICNVQIGASQATGTGTDNRPSEDSNMNGTLDAGEDLNGNGQIDDDTGIFFVQLINGAVNLTLNVAPFVPGDPQASFTAARTNPAFPAVGDIRVTDGAGNTCTSRVQLGTFDPFGGIVNTPNRTVRLRLTRPSPDTEGVRCVETTNPADPDFDNLPFVPFDSEEIDFELLLSEGDGEKVVCCQFIDDEGDISPPVCSTIVLSTGGGTCQDGDGDGFGSPGDSSCPGGPQEDCNDANGAINPGATEDCDNGVDDDCDTLVDDLDTEDCEPLLVVLESFTAEVTGRGVELRWRTSFEIDNAGFKVLRSKDAGVTVETLTSHVISARGTELTGADYLFFDDSRQQPGTVQYYLEDIDLSGHVTRHGPVVVEIRRPILTPNRFPSGRRSSR